MAAAVDGWQPGPVRRISVSEAFLQAGLPDPLDPTTEEALRAAVQSPPDDTWEDAFFRGMLNHVESNFEPDEITILHGYPASMAALAQLDARDPRKAERFEVYVGQLELGNAFGELTDPIEQRRRFESDLEARRQAGQPTYPIDEGLLEDLARIPEAAGIALGFDRLLMRCLGLSRIQDVMCFS